MSTTKSIINVALFQLGWWGCIGVAVYDISPAISIPCSLLILFIHFYFYVPREEVTKHLIFCATIGLIGIFFDAIFHATGVLTIYNMSLVPPIWLCNLWFIYPIAFGHGFSWFSGKWALCLVLGAIGGPLSYRFGASLDILSMGSGIALFIFATYWAIFLTLGVFSYDYFLKADS